MKKKPKEIKSTITYEQISEWGMTVTGDPIIVMEKVLRESEIGKLSICITRERNCDLFALFLPDGAHIFLNPASIEDLKKFGEIISEYEPNY